MKHPKDKAERMYIDAKKRRKNKREIPVGSSGTVPSDIEDEREDS